jgi:Protein of unknown function (DUF1549)/Protein of unknown function (DUF1553)/Planctomycete cytochrome C
MRSLLWLPLSIATAAIGADPEGSSAPLTAFQDRVWPVLENSCLRCHGAEKQKGDLRLDSREAALKGGENGPALVPGDAAKSLMLRLVKHEDPDREMPPKDRLLDQDVAAMESWIQAGAPWPDQLATSSSGSSEKLGDAWTDPRNPIVKIFGGKRLDLWSFKPISNPQPPAVKDATWVRNPIDAFVLARFEAAGEHPSPEADRRTLIRRLSYDLTGLPPTPEQTAAFLADTSPEAYQNLVETFLKSPSYGEHWARLWLDVVRYSDSNGFDWDEFRPQAWRFRDYVIRSLNADKPYDRFVKEQIAGDELVPGAPRSATELDSLIATGFLRIGPYDNSASKFGEDLRCRTQVMSDLVETTGSAFLGLTFACCRCHNHKFDPISQQDYYRLRSFFEGVADGDRVPLNPPAEQAEIEKHNQALITQINAKDAICADIAARQIERLRKNRLAKLSAEDKALLETPEDKLDKNGLHKLLMLKKKVEPRVDQIRSFLDEADGKRFDQALAEKQALLAQGRAYLNAFIAKDDSASPPLTRLLFQGDFRQPREIVAPGFLSALDPNPAQIAKSERPESSGRRTTLAEWIVSKDNPLPSRVMVNRVWQSFFGIGIQASGNDFGFAGTKPEDPALLDWLARQFMEQGWSLKSLQRLIVTSATYRQQLTTKESAAPACVTRRGRRLTAEQLRDAMLLVSGSLKPCDGGPARWPELPEELLHSNPSLQDDTEFPLKGWHTSPPGEANVRSVYLVQKRGVRMPMMEAFDLPDNTLSCPRRNVSTVAPQALALLNDPFSIATSKAFAARIERESGADRKAQIDRVFALALQRAPDEAEQQKSLTFLEQRTLAEFCRVVLNLNEFAYVD